MTDTSTAAVDAMINLLSRPHGNLTGGEKLDAAKMIAAISSQLEAANARHAAALSTVDKQRATIERLTRYVGADMLGAVERACEERADRLDGRTHDDMPGVK